MCRQNPILFSSLTNINGQFDENNNSTPPPPGTLINQASLSIAGIGIYEFTKSLYFLEMSQFHLPKLIGSLCLGEGWMAKRRVYPVRLIFISS